MTITGEAVIRKAIFLFQSIMADFEDYVAAEGEDNEIRREVLVERLNRMPSQDLAKVLLVTMDMLHEVGPDAVLEVLKKRKAS